MTKKQLICILLAAVCVVCLAACSNDGANASSDQIEDYASWTKADWDKASADQKYNAAADVIRQVQAPQTSLEEYVQECKDDPGLDAEVIEAEGLIDAAFAAQDGITLGDAAIDVSGMAQDQQ